MTLISAAQASEILAFAAIERAARDEAGTLSGFQRPQIAEHIREIRRYLERDEAVLPNAIVVAFLGGVETRRRAGGLDIGCVALADGGVQQLVAIAGVGGSDVAVKGSLVLAVGGGDWQQGWQKTTKDCRSCNPHRSLFTRYSGVSLNGAILASGTHPVFST
jgi:hypothetical protein